MKKLYILRHAKSSWDEAGLMDYDRPLSERGLYTAPFMGELIARNGFLPDLFLCSPAKRASQTAKLVKENSGSNAKIRYDQHIYDAGTHSLKQAVSEVEDEFESVMLVGHNPGLEGFVKYLTGQFEPMPTAALAVIDLNISHWADISADCYSLQTVIRPKEEMK